MNVVKYYLTLKQIVTGAYRFNKAMFTVTSFVFFFVNVSSFLHNTTILGRYIKNVTKAEYYSLVFKYRFTNFNANIIYLKANTKSYFISN